MGSPHVCFADELERNNNAPGSSSTKKWLLELEPTLSLGGHQSPSSSLSISPTPRYERNMGFFQQLSRRFGLRSSDDLVHGGGSDDAPQEEDANSSSTDSYSSAGRGLAAAAAAASHASTRLELMSCASSETSSTIDIEEQQPEQQQQLQQGSKRKTMSRTSFSRLHRRSTSSLRRAFESLSLTSRSLSCSGPSPPPPSQSQSQAANSSTALPLKSALKSASTVELHHQHHHHHRVASKSVSSSSACSNNSSSSVASTAGKSKPAKAPPQRILRQPVSYTYLKGMSGLPTQRVPRSSVCCQYARR